GNCPGSCLNSVNFECFIEDEEGRSAEITGPSSSSSSSSSSSESDCSSLLSNSSPEESLIRALPSLGRTQYRNQYFPRRPLEYTSDNGKPSHPFACDGDLETLEVT
uniref:Uncharacterized protein n=1 Tax=Clytia hemisphaerica TaxID=252671 RepID=A0A7M5WYB5_9CNID